MILGNINLSKMGKLVPTSKKATKANKRNKCVKAKEQSSCRPGQSVIRFNYETVLPNTGVAAVLFMYCISAMLFN